jgi:ABC transport system ATP-binding/permease protein
MQQYTMQESARLLGVDIDTLQHWLSQNGRGIHSETNQQLMLDQAQVEQLAREHNVPSYIDTNNIPAQSDVPQIHPFALDAPVITIGRYTNNMVVLRHPQVSGYHARLERGHKGDYRIIDRGSMNHVYVNAQRVRVKELNPGDIIRIGPFSLTYTGKQLIQQDESYSIRIDAVHLKTTGRRHTILLNDLSIDIPPRTFVALVGSSGVGKSMLLDALSGLRPAKKGVVLYNGQDYYSDLALFSTQIGYVPQDDIIYRDLTVEQNLYYTARMRLPRDFTKVQIRQLINEVLDEVEIQHRRDFLVRNLSGGERKRVSIALELLANPSVFFLDEPTAGLDPGLDRKMMLLLRKLANKGHTIVLVTHATNNIHFCDFVCFLAQGGRLAFYGPPADAEAYFGTSDFAEIYNALEPTVDNKNIPVQVEENFKRSPYFQRYVREPLDRELAGRNAALETTVLVKRPKSGRPWKQFSLLSRRYLQLLTHDVGNFLILLLQAPLIGLILFYLALPGTFDSTSVTTCPLRSNPLANSGRVVSINCQRVVDLLETPQGKLLAQQQGETPQQALENAITPNSGADAQTLLFTMAFAAVLFGCLNGVLAIVRDVPIYRRERMVNLGIAPYMFSKIAILGVFCLIQSAILVYLVNLKTPFHQGIFLPIVVEVYITMALTTLAGLMLGLVISALAPNTDRAMSFVPLVLIPQVIFSGIIFKLDTPILQALGALFAARWAMAGLGSSVGLHGDKLGVDDFSYQGTHFVALNPASAVPGAILHLLLIWCVLLAIIVIQGLAIAIFLKRRDVKA